VIVSPISPLYRKIALRLMPFLMLLYMVAFLDRVNVSFAALTMNRDLGISESLYGFAAGIFFLGYCLFEVPANIVLARVGARRWIAIMMVGWGLISVGTAFVASRPQYVALRFLLGIAESGFYPGVIFYLTMWVPRPIRARFIAPFMMVIPLCNLIGSPISSHLLLLDAVGGLKGWQWLFVLEGAPAIVLGAVAWFVLVDGPGSAQWLSVGEREWLAGELHNDERKQVAGSGGAWANIVQDSATYFMYSVGLYGLTFWLPKILVSTGASTIATGWWAALPYGAGAIAMLQFGLRQGSTRLEMLFLIGAVGFACAGMFQSMAGALAGFCVAAVGLLSAGPIFWGISTSRMTGRMAGAGIAIVNSVGAVGGFTGPSLMGWLRDKTQGYSAGLWAIAAAMILAALLSPKRQPTAASSVTHSAT
jgi:ACS family tartrate transporter-like MFS transporter